MGLLAWSPTSSDFSFCRVTLGDLLRRQPQDIELAFADALVLHPVVVVCFKTFGAGKLHGDTSGYNQPLKQRPRGKLSSGGSDDNEALIPRLTVAECLHFTLTLDPDVALLGMSYPNEQDAAFAAARSFSPLTQDQMTSIRDN